MHRDLHTLASQVWDVVVIGGGIYGACVAWEAAGRGLAVALLEKADFASATSANSLKTIHGGFRYLQHLDFPRVRESVVERQNLMRIAPHLVHPLPVLVPTYGHGLKGREVLAAALVLYETLSLDRNRLADPQKHIPPGRVLSRAECLDALPGIEARRLTGGTLFYDAQAYNSERLVLAFLETAAQAGAQVANYARVTGLLRTGEHVSGVTVQDQMTGTNFEVRAKTVVNTAGPWIGQVLDLAPTGKGPTAFPLVKAVNVITRPIFEQVAVGLIARNGFSEKDKLIARKASLLFVSPWRGKSIIGTTYASYSGPADDFRATRTDVNDLVEAFNASYPQAGLQFSDVSFAHAGLLPAANVGGLDEKLLNHYRILDHRQDGAAGLFSVVGVKYTTARQVAEKMVDRIFTVIKKAAVPSRTAFTPLAGGKITDFEMFLGREIQKQPCGLDGEQVRGLIYNYGSNYPEVLKELNGPALVGEATDAECRLVQAQTRYAVRHEMALHLDDVLLRRTELATAGVPAQRLIDLSARVMAQMLNWDDTRRQSEVAAFKRAFDWMNS